MSSWGCCGRAFARTEPWLQAWQVRVGAGQRAAPGEWVEHRAARRGPDAGSDQRLLNHAVWDTFGAMAVVRRFAVAGLEAAARRGRRRGGMVIGAIDETGQEKAGQATRASSASTWGARGRWPTGSTPCTCPTCGKAPGTR